jgi:hypothetical protein
MKVFIYMKEIDWIVRAIIIQHNIMDHYNAIRKPKQQSKQN